MEAFPERIYIPISQGTGRRGSGPDLFQVLHQALMLLVILDPGFDLSPLRFRTFTGEVMHQLIYIKLVLHRSTSIFWFLNNSLRPDCPLWFGASVLLDDLLLLFPYRLHGFPALPGRGDRLVTFMPFVIAFDGHISVLGNRLLHKRMGKNQPRFPTRIRVDALCPVISLHGLNILQAPC